MEKLEAVTIVTIKNKIPLFKGEEQANSIELIELQEVGYELVSQIGLYQVGDKAVLIQPDYNVSDISLFESFIRPNGDESKSMLGKVEGSPRRIRAKKFNLSKEPNGDPVYSNGILLPKDKVLNYIRTKKNVLSLDYLLPTINWTEELDITKYEEPEIGGYGKGGCRIGQSEGKFPEGLYKTDEENVNNLWNHLENKIGYPVVLVGTEKVDGSSITIGITPNVPEGFICSRNLRKKLTIEKVIGYREPTKWEIFKSWFGIIPNLGIIKEVDNDDDFVKYGKPILNRLKLLGLDNIILRGELNGGSLKGSGNKNNPSSKEQANIKIFGVDKIVNNICQKQSYCFLRDDVPYYGFNTVPVVFEQIFESKEHILRTCEEYFKKRMCEGIIIRTIDSRFSAKVMNLLYDSKK